MQDGGQREPGQPTDGQSRRRVLLTIGAGGALTLAGCVGGDSVGGDDSADGGSGETSSDDGATTSSGSGNQTAQMCDLLTTDLSPYEAGETVMLCNFDVPSTLTGEFGTGVGEFVHQTVQRAEGDNGATELSFQVMAQYTEKNAMTYEPDRSGDVAVETEFNGQPVEMYRLGTDMPEDIPGKQRLLGGSLPYTVDGVELYFPVTVRSEIDPAPEQSVPEECATTMVEVTEAMASSLRLNEQNTLAETIPEQWEEWPPE